jgi:hypothetical protein
MKNLSGGPFWGILLVLPTGHKQQTRLETLARDKHSSFLGKEQHSAE